MQLIVKPASIADWFPIVVTPPESGVSGPAVGAALAVSPRRRLVKIGILNENQSIKEDYTWNLTSKQQNKLNNFNRNQSIKQNGDIMNLKGAQLFCWEVVHSLWRKIYIGFKKLYVEK